MKNTYHIKTSDGFYIGKTGEFVTSVRKDRFTTNNKKFATWYVKNTNFFGNLRIVKERKVVTSR